MIKNVDVAVFETIKKVVDNKFTSGEYEFGLVRRRRPASLYDDKNKAKIPEAVATEMKTISKQIIDGRIRSRCNSGGGQEHDVSHHRLAVRRRRPAIPGMRARPRSSYTHHQALRPARGQPRRSTAGPVADDPLPWSARTAPAKSHADEDRVRHVRADAGEIGSRASDRAPARRAVESRGPWAWCTSTSCLVGSLTVAENVILGQELRRGWSSTHPASAEIRALSRKFGLDVDPAMHVRGTSRGAAAAGRIVKVLWRGCDVADPRRAHRRAHAPARSATCSACCAGGRRWHDGGAITHKLDRCSRIADHVTVMRRAAWSPRWRAASCRWTRSRRAMVGRPVLLQIDKPPPKVGARCSRSATSASPAARPGIAAVRGCRLTVRAGEILGFAGVEGNGRASWSRRSSAARRRFGQRGDRRPRAHRAAVYDRYGAGWPTIPEDSATTRALILDDSIAENLILGQQRDSCGRLDITDRGRIRRGRSS